MVTKVLKKVGSMNRTKKIRYGRYEYRGYIIQQFGYYHPEHRICWEGIDQKGNAIAHGFTKRSIIREIDYMLDETYKV
jgi:hypothetical protein